jgi:CubicO group peptidase (beta-lactamase class C family)
VNIMAWLAKIGLGLALMVGLVLVVCLIAFVVNPVLIGRYYAVVSGADTVNRIDTLEPLEKVSGANVAAPTLSLAPLNSLSKVARDQAIALAQATSSQNLIVWIDGGIALEHYGTGFDQNSLSSPASMMKSVLSLAIGVAADKGKLKLTDPVGLYIAAWKDDPRGKITFEQLLTMSSGLSHAPFSLNPFSPYMTSWLSQDVNKVALESSTAFPAGTHYQYSNINAQILAIALEGATGQRLAAWLSEAIWAPIGARDASVWLDRPNGAARGYCCLLATARDWLRLGLLIKDGGRVGATQVVSRSYIDAMIKPSPNYPNFGYHIWRASPYTPARSYGAGVRFTVPAKEPFLAPDMVYFDGNGGQRVYVSPALGLVIVRIGTPKMDWDDSTLPNMIIRGLKPKAP